MNLITWNEEYTVGIKQLDEQHQQLVNLINQFHAAMREGKGSQIASDVLQKLVEYTHYHFLAEEKLLETCNYPGYVSHKAKHHELIEQVQDFQAKYQRSSVGLSIPMMEFLKSWLIDHILGVDKQYSQYLQNKGVS